MTPAIKLARLERALPAHRQHGIARLLLTGIPPRAGTPGYWRTYNAKRRSEARASRRCRDCGKPCDRGSRAFCLVHLVKHREQEKARAARKRAAEKAERERA